MSANPDFFPDRRAPAEQISATCAQRIHESPARADQATDERTARAKLERVHAETSGNGRPV